MHGGRLRRRATVGVGGLGAWRHRGLLRFGGSRLRRTLDVFPISLVGLRHTHTHRSVGFSGGGGVSREGETETTEAMECSHVLVPPPPSLPCRAETVGRSGFRGRSADTGSKRSSSSEKQLLLVPHIQLDQTITTGDPHAFFKEIKKKNHSVRAAVQDCDPQQHFYL